MFERAQLNLFKSDKMVGVLSLTGKSKERSDKSFMSPGMNAIIQDGSFQSIYTIPELMDQYEYTLLSLTSCTDVLTAISNLPKKRKTRVIVGGAGCINVNALKDQVDIINYGRCDGLIDAIIDGYRDDSAIDVRDIGQTHKVRQATKLYDVEKSIGCKYNCKFCQYTHVRELHGDTYHPGLDLGKYEDNFIDFEITGSDRYTSAFDGLSQATRYAVGKPISDDLIIDKLSDIIARNYSRPVIIKIFNIVGYPWETAESVMDDLAAMREMFRKIDMNTAGCKGRVFIMMMFTPFSPEPLTPMALTPANVSVYWRDVLEQFGRQLYKSHRIEVMVLPHLNSPLTLLKRVCVNRGASYDELQALIKEKRPKELSWPEYMQEIVDKHDLGRYVGWQDQDVNLTTYKPIKYITKDKTGRWPWVSV